jgi:hypothetical protein
MIIFQVPLINKDDYFDTFNYTSYVCVFFSNLFPSYCIYSLICTRLSPFFFLVIRVLRSLLYSHVHQFRFCCPNS